MIGVQYTETVMNVPGGETVWIQEYEELLAQGLNNPDLFGTSSLD